jgi:hypothetical protein
VELDAFNAELGELGLAGPMGELRLPDGSFVLIYKNTADGSHKHIPPGSSLTPDQRADTIAELKRHLAAIENKRLGYVKI